MKTSRREFMKKTVLSAAALSAFAMGCGQNNGRHKPTLAQKKDFTGKRPNIVIINCDDLGYGDLSLYGGTAINTPNINRLAAGGKRFASFYAANSICTPSRFGLLTGRYAKRGGLDWVHFPEDRMSFIKRIGFWLYRCLTKIGLMDMGMKPKSDGIPSHEITIAEGLKVAGYNTGMVGKWHLGDFHRQPEYHPCKFGFDFFYGVPHGTDMPGNALYRNNECLSPHVKEKEKLTGMYTEEALKFINDSKVDPFFLYFAHTYPHQPYFASEKFKGKSKAGRYGDTVEEIDWSVGQIMAALKKKRILENTLVVFTSDNGPYYYGSAGRLRGRKGESREGGYRVPTIAYWPGHIKAGTVSDEPAMHTDFFPTCLALAGVELPKDRIIDGVDITSLLTGKGKKPGERAFWFYHNEDLEGLRLGKWKYYPKINSFMSAVPMDKNWQSAGSHHAPWLYNMKTDPGEAYNLKKDYPHIVQKMDNMFKAWNTKMKANPEGWKNQP